MQKYLLQIKLLYILIFSLCFSQGRFNLLEDIKGKSVENSWWYYPVVVVTPRPDGGYIVFWAEREEMREEYSFPPEHYFYRIVDTNGKYVVYEKELDFWRVAPHPTYFGVSFNTKSMLWLDSTKLLIIAWKSLGHPHKLERIIMNSNGNIISGPDSIMDGAVGPDAVLIRDSKTNIYAVEKSMYAIKVMQVYPEFSQVRRMSDEDYRNFYKKYPAHTYGFTDPVFVITSDNKLLICCHVGWGYTPLEQRGLWDTFRPDKIFYILADLEANFITEPIILNIISSAYRKIPGVHLGGSYYNLDSPLNIDKVKLVSKDMDVFILPNGEIVLFVTVPDKNGILDVYQLKFTPEGKFVKPENLEIVDARPLPTDMRLPVIKSARAIVYGKDMWRTDLVLFGFDEEGNFYSEREIWKENVK